jgi:hypothetical protein
MIESTSVKAMTVNIANTRFDRRNGKSSMGASADATAYALALADARTGVGNNSAA